MPNAGIYILGLAVMLWTAGFDIIYSCQDHAFDRKENLYSVPIRFGIRTSLYITKALHTLTVILLVLCGISFSLGMIYYAGILIVAVCYGIAECADILTESLLREIEIGKNL